jgi:drug/metabolite transporter (DMT)-like permease
MSVLALLLALVAAVAYAIGWVLQQREAAAQEEGGSLSPALLLHLLRRPLWLVGIGAMIVGNLLQAAALGIGGLTLVEPVIVLSLLFALPLGAALSRQMMRRGEWVAAIAVSVGVAVLILISQPTETTRVGDPVSWTLAGAATAGATAILVSVGLKYDGVPRAVSFAISAGLLLGLSDATTKSLFDLVNHHGTGVLLTSWQTYALVATAVYALLLSQDAYKAAPLPASLPPITVVEPIVGMVIGVFVLGEHFTLNWAAGAGELAALGLMVWGTYRLAQSPLVCAEKRADEERKAAEHGRHEHEESAGRDRALSA